MPSRTGAPQHMRRHRTEAVDNDSDVLRTGDPDYEYPSRLRDRVHVMHETVDLGTSGTA
ncbi:hypothetical protein APR12_003099 [Nocardia amikacinitolerans]|nr:hypothetical protein [Nocardia amikacinitolerans]